MKRIWTAMLPLLLCAVLAGCSAPELPGEMQIAEDLSPYYERQDYELRGEDRVVPLQRDFSVVLQEWEQNVRENTAVIRCGTRIAAEGDLFERCDAWVLRYTYSKKDQRWELTDKECVKTEYQLLSDLSETLCVELLRENADCDFTFVSVVTDRTDKTAVAVYTYEEPPVQLGAYGSIARHASVDASFAWDSEGGWTYTGSAMNEESSCICNLRCHIGFNGEGMLKTDEFTVEFDLVVIDNMVCFENLYYQGSPCTLGTLHIGNAHFSAVEEGKSVCITFDFVRDVHDIEQDQNYVDSDEFRSFYRTISGTGSVVIEEDAAGTWTAELSLPGFIAWHNDRWNDFRQGGIELTEAGKRRWPGFSSDRLPEPEPVVPSPGADTMSQGEEESEVRTCVGRWVFTAPESMGISGSIEVDMREDGTCTAVAVLDMGRIKRSSTYRVVEDISQLPADLIDNLIFGTIPVVSVVYDAQADRLYVCLDEGLYVYLSRADSGETGGIYEP